MANIADITALLRKRYPSSFNRKLTPFQVLISTVLSQRTNDRVTYPTAERLFSRYGTPGGLASAGTREITDLIRGVGFYRVKAKRIRQISRILLKKYKGEVPKSVEELLKLPGVGRKTANCVLVYAFRTPAIPVDVHVHRITNRIGLVKTQAPEKTETALTRSVPKKYWIHMNELLVQHGQQTCKPTKPLCQDCPVTKYCDYYRTIYKKQNKK